MDYFFEKVRNVKIYRKFRSAAGSKGTVIFAIKDNWNKENLAVVAFVYNDKEGVVQAAEYKLQENNNILKSK